MVWTPHSYYIGQEKNSALAKKYFDLAISCTDIFSNLEIALELSYVFEDEYIDKLECNLFDQRSDFFPRSFYLYAAELKARNEKYEEAISFYESAFKYGLGLGSYLLYKSYTLLRMKKYDQIIKLYETYQNISKTLSFEAFIINVQAAAKEINSKYFNEVALRNLYAHSSSIDVKICAYSLLGQDRDAKRLISKKINSNYLTYYRFKRWPAICSKLMDDFSIEETAA